ncbi:MAG: hypothetical protein AUK43_19715 [Oscillatoriales cyanobacterium CG2_30_40_61]|nr:MAG: hypothetical protein AUK43_19715 [Oscillatoriales cyanobacterium CG2_30_40_61]
MQNIMLLSSISGGSVKFCNKINEIREWRHKCLTTVIKLTKFGNGGINASLRNVIALFCNFYEFL